MASIATPKFLSDQDRAYNEQYRAIWLEHENKLNKNELTHRGQQLMQKLEKRYHNVEKTPPTHFSSDHLWQFIAFDLAKLPFRERRRKARYQFCLRHNNLAWYLQMPRRKFIAWRFHFNKFEHSDYLFASLAIDGEIYNAGVYKNWSFPSHRTIENWLEDFDLPDLKNIDKKSPWHTLQEWVVLCAHFEVKNAPKTMMEMRKFVRHLGYRIEKKEKKGETLYKDIIIKHLEGNQSKRR